MKNLTRREFLRHYGWRIGAGLLLLGLLIYTIYHVFGSSSANLLTTPARDVVDYQHYFGTGYLFRDEEVLTTENDGLVDPQVPNATKVGRGVVVAKVYPAEGDLAAKQQRLAIINRQIALLEESELPLGSSASRITEYRKAAERIYLSLRRQVASGFYLSVETLSDDFFVECNRIANLLDAGSSAKELLEDYQKERDALLSGTPESIVPEGFSGYYYNADEVDGYEADFKVDLLETLSAESLEALANESPKRPDGRVVGKIVYDYRWHLVIPVASEIADLLSVGDLCTARFSSNAGKELELLCERILPGKDGEVLLVAGCGESPTDFLFFRSQPVELLIENCSGYYVPESALRTVKGELGTFVFEGGTTYFRRVEILYRGDGYVIAKRHEETGRGYLAANDLMVTSGRNLTDGKAYR